jgi:hypothetical protein
MVSMMAADPERQNRFIRRRNAAVLWMPAVLVAALAGGYTHSWLAVVAVLLVVGAALIVYSERPALFRR